MTSSPAPRASRAPLPSTSERDAPLEFPSLPPLALYVHLPWCIRKCPYCDFNSYEAPTGEVADDAYVAALLRDLDAELPLARGRPLESVYIGGGTPSLFSGRAIRRLLDGIRGRVPLAADAEITLEANPGAADAERFTQYRDAGVTRLSIGVQSFRAQQLRRLGRVHGPDEAAHATGLAGAAGFASVNLDLMYGLPDDDVAGALGDLRAALALAPPHLSWYQLTLEPNTAFHRRPPSLPTEEAVLEIEHHGRELLDDHGYERYEISAYARPDKRCKHNLNYWEFGDYLGIGAGAHGKVTLPAERAIERRAKTRNPRTYASTAGTPRATASDRMTDTKQVALEAVMNALRLPDGIAAATFEQRAGQPLAGIARGIDAAKARGWLRDDAQRLRATPAGQQMLNQLLALFC
jgi:oxygen-independent coproporphyrinogen-3 oxidase